MTTEYVIMAKGDDMGKGSKEAIARATKKYNEKHTRQYNMKLNLETDKDIIVRLEKQESMQGYIKALIRKDIEENL